MSDKIYGYVIINKETGEQWGKTYTSKSGASKSYNDHFNSWWQNPRHKFSGQDVYELKPLVIKDE